MSWPLEKDVSKVWGCSSVRIPSLSYLVLLPRTLSFLLAEPTKEVAGGQAVSSPRARALVSLWLGCLRFARSFGQMLPMWQSVPRSPDSTSSSPSIRPCCLSPPGRHSQDTLISESDSMSIFQLFATTFRESKA